jgi:hypothetical protein
LIEEQDLLNQLMRITEETTREPFRGAVQTASENPRLEFRDGQFFLALTTPLGASVERYVSDASVREAFSKIPIDAGWLRPEIARWGDGKHGEWAVAFFPPSVYELEITSESATARPAADGGPVGETAATPVEPVFELQRLQVPLPGLVFLGLGTNYFIWAVKTAKLEPFHEVYRAPLPNVYLDARVCWGLVKPPRANARSIFNAWDLFMKSTFNNHLASGKSKSHHDDARILLRHLAAKDHGNCPSEIRVLCGYSQAEKYPTQELVRQVENVGVTLDKAIRQYFETGAMPE